MLGLVGGPLGGRHRASPIPRIRRDGSQWAMATDDWTAATPAGGVALPPFWDGLRYFTLRDDDIACGSEVDVRVRTRTVSA